MSNELLHKDIGDELTKAEFHATDLHVLDAQAAGDIIYASSTTQLTRLGKGTDGHVLTLASGIPSWAAGGLTVSETEVFNGTAPTSWTDLDLSGTIGANAALVLLKIYGAGNNNTMFIRRNGDTDDLSDANASYSVGLCGAWFVATDFAVLMTPTDTSGVIEWVYSAASTVVIDVIAYIK